MNTFKLVLAICSFMAVTSGQYTQSGRPSWESPTVSQPLVPAKTEAASEYQTLPVPAHTNIPASAFPIVTQQICTCTAVPESTAAGMLEKYQQPSSGAATAQPSASAQPSAAQQAAYAQTSQQEALTTLAPARNWFYATTAASVEVTRQDPYARPAYAAPGKVTGY